MQLATHGVQLITHGVQLITRGMQLVTHGVQLITHGVQLDAHGAQLVAQGMQLATHGVQLITHGYSYGAKGSRKLQRVADPCEQARTLRTRVAQTYERRMTIQAKPQARHRRNYRRAAGEAIQAPTPTMRA